MGCVLILLSLKKTPLYVPLFPRSLQSELTFYGQSVLRLGVLPSEELSRERFERLWGVGVRH